MLDKLKALISESLEIDLDEVETADTDTVDNWDSLRHMNMIAALEDEFDIEMEPDDVIEMTSYAAIVDVLKKYGVAL